ncbi:MAG: MBL fold metallo-hydrolase, partial [Brevinematales bacterium]
ILIDSGCSGDFHKIEEALDNAGCLPGNLKLIIITHGDGDHTGSASYIRNKYDSVIAMHKYDSDMAESFDKKTDRLKKRKAKGLVSGIMWKTVMFISCMKFNREKEKAAFSGFKPGVYLDDGQDFNEYGFPAKVLYIPGHTNGSIGILTGTGDLFCGDLLYNYKKPAVWPQGEDLKAIDSSVERLKKFKIGMVYPGHGKPFGMNSMGVK